MHFAPLQTLRGINFCVYYLFKTNSSGRNKIWGAQKQLGAVHLNDPTRLCACINVKKKADSASPKGCALGGRLVDLVEGPPGFPRSQKWSAQGTNMYPAYVHQ